MDSTPSHAFRQAQLFYFVDMLAILCESRRMANNLPTEKKVLAISMLAEGNSIRSIERMTGVHRDTIMRLPWAEAHG